MRTLFAALCGLTIVVFSGAPCFAQIDRASITGVVTDPSGAVIPNAKVTITDAATKVMRATMTNSSGVYVLAALPASTYSVAISRPGFRTVHVVGLRLFVGQTRTLNERLELAAASTRVVVQAHGNALNETNADWNGEVTRTDFDQLPENGRDWTTLLLLAPGATDDGGGTQREIRFAGRARDDNNYTMDGVDATGVQEMAQKSSTRLQISQDAVAEYNVSSMLYTADHGYGAGGHVDIETRSGTNQYHGDAFEYFRNSALDSRDFLDPGSIPPFRYNDFGGSFGGPIQRDRTFFFANFEGAREFLGVPLVGFVPSASLKAQVLTTSPQMAPIMNAYPNGNVPTSDPSTDEYVHLGSTQVREDSWTARLDHAFNDRTSMFVRATRDVNFTASPLGNLNDLQELHINPANYAISVDHSFSPTVFNSFEFGINRSPYHNPQASVFGIQVDTDSFDSLNNNSTDNEVGTTFGYIDNLTIQHGRHTLKFGAEFRRIWLNQGQTAAPDMFFTDNNSLINDQLASFSQVGNWCCYGYRRFLIMPYAQDLWKIKPNFTMGLGLRWEYYSVPTEALGRTRVFDLYGCHGICPKGSPTEFPNYRNFDPRFSLAWAPERFHGHTVIRSGFGIYSGPGQNDDTNAALESNNNNISLSSADVPNLSYPYTPFLPLASQVGVTPRALDRHRRDLYAEEWGLFVDQELPDHFMLETGYMGDHGVRLFARSYVNTCLQPPDPTTGFCLRLLPDFGIVDIKYNDGLSMFDAFQASLKRTFTHGLMWESNYMWSNSQNDASVGGGEANAPENVNCVSCEWGPSIYDIRHVFTTAVVYDLPVGSGHRFLSSPGLASRVFGGWTLSSVSTFRTGHPLTVVVGRDPSTIPDGNDHSTQRPDLVAGVPIIPPNQGPNNWINPAAFAMPANDTFGNAGNGIVRAPGWWSIDMGLQKTVKLNERLKLDFRAEAFNIFNHDPFGDPSQLDFTSAGFGIINTTVNYNTNNDNIAPMNTGSGLPREIEFMVRLNF